MWGVGLTAVTPNIPKGAIISHDEEEIRLTGGHNETREAKENQQ